MAQISLSEQTAKILEIAKNAGVEQNFLFVTTFKRYQVQLKLLSQLEAELNESGILITKEYVKGRQNVYSHPAVSGYSKMADSANRTASTLMKIVISMKGVTMSVEDDDNDL